MFVMARQIIKSVGSCLLYC